MNTNNLQTFLDKYEIVDGPSRDLLFDALKYRYDQEQHIRAYFDVKNSRPGSLKFIFRLAVSALKHADTSGHFFNLSGACILPNGKYYECEAHYNAKTRTGWIGILPNWD